MNKPFRIDPGPLTSVSSFYKWTIKPLHALSDLIREGKNIRIEWDLRSVEFQRINLGALVSFLSTAHRVRGYVDEPPLVLLTWNPRILGFLEDISFFSIARSWDICRFQEEIIGGYTSGTTNPDTGLMAFEYSESPNHIHEIEEWKVWKDKQRLELTTKLLMKTKNIFDSRRKKLGLPSNAKSIVATSTAELVLNSILWGESSAFVGLQRSSKRISVVVADSGQGFLHSLHQNRWRNTDAPIKNHSQALVVASMINNRDYGLKKVINLITEHGGWVEMSSYSSELRWSYPSWLKANSLFPQTLDGDIQLLDLVQESFGDSIGHASPADKSHGYYRNWSRGIRGSRINFEYPLDQETRR